jgi:hypothetical protein
MLLEYNVATIKRGKFFSAEYAKPRRIRVWDSSAKQQI